MGMNIPPRTREVTGVFRGDERRGDAAATTWIVCLDESRRRRGYDVDSPSRRVVRDGGIRRGRGYRKKTDRAITTADPWTRTMSAAAIAK